MSVQPDAPPVADPDREAGGRHAFLLGLSDALRPLTDAVEVQEVATRMVAERIGDRARVTYVEIDDDGLASERGFGDGGTTAPRRVPLDAFGERLLGPYRRGETVVIEDVATDVRLTEADRVAQHESRVRAFVAATLLKDGRWVAALITRSPVPRLWSDADVTLTQDAVERIWSALEHVRAQEALRRSEARLRLALEATGAGTFVWHPGEDRADHDVRMRELMDVPPGSDAGLAWALERRIHPDDRATYAAAVARALEPNGSRRIDEEFRVVRPDGSVRWLAVRGRLEEAGAARLEPAMYGTVTDVTDRRLAQDALPSRDERQAFLLVLSDTLRSLTDPIAIATTASTLLAQRIGAALVIEGEVIDDVVVVHGGHSASGRTLDGRYPLAAFGRSIVNAYQRGEDVVVNDAGGHPEVRSDVTSFAAAFGMAAAIAVPLPRTATWGALLVAADAAPRSWTAAEIDLTREVARRTWAAMDALRGEEALRDSEARLRTLVENITDYAIYRTNARGIITDWTEGAARVKGYAAHEVIGRHVSMFHTPEDVARGTVERVFQEAARTGRSEHETWKVRAGGERFWANEITSPLRDATGRVVGFTRISRDLTAQRRIEAQREEQLEQERTRREAAEAFMAVMSHELKTPVTSIYSAASLIRKAPARPDLTELVDDIEEEADRLLRIVDDLLVLSGVDRGLIMLAPEPILIHHALDDVVATVGHRFPDVTFDLERTGLLPIVLADPTALRQVANNLLTNAAKYAGRDGPVRIETAEAGGDVIVRILDRGPGLGPDPDALFTLFHRAPHTAKLASGTGIGLYVARQLVDAMGGRMGAEPRDGGGSTFWFALPVAPVEEDV